MMHCNTCDEDYSNASCGGPGICPSCDCGTPPALKKAKRLIAELMAEVSQLTQENDELRGAIATRQELPPSGVPTPAPTCEWRDDGDGLYEASCGLAWNFIDGTPAENNTRFCPGCGKSLIVKPAPKYDDDDDGGSPTPAQQEAKAE